MIWITVLHLKCKLPGVPFPVEDALPFFQENIFIKNHFQKNWARYFVSKVSHRTFLKCWTYISTIIFIIFWDSLMFYQVLLSPKGKLCAIITYKHGIYELPHELPNDLKLTCSWNYIAQTCFYELWQKN